VTDLLSCFQQDDAPSKRWLERHLDHQDREFCLIWPLSRAQNGYPTCGANGAIRPHRIMCERRHGPAPSEHHQAAHSCGNGHLGCVNMWHLNWRTPSENQLERFDQQGSPRPRWRLTVEQVDEIRAMKGRERTVDTAVRFQVSEANIRQIQSGKTWSKERHGMRQFTSDEVIRIRTGTQEAKDYAAEFGVSLSIIYRIRSGSTYKWVEMPGSHQRSQGE
jgi:hypothetical protein